MIHWNTNIFMRARHIPYPNCIQKTLDSLITHAFANICIASLFFLFFYVDSLNTRKVVSMKCFIMRHESCWHTGTE